jgi:glycerate 2-kinase
VSAADPPGDPRRNPIAFLRALYDTAVDRAQPASVITRFLPDPPKGRTIVVGAGKSAAAMAAALEANWAGPLEGVVVTRYGHAVSTSTIRVLEAAHPVPDDMSLAAAGQILRAVGAAGSDDLVIVLLSGGGSALLSAPLEGLPFATKQAITRALVHSGASIAEINCVRKHLSAVKGGRLLVAAAPAKVVTLAISDVVGDDPATIASGPTVPDLTTQAEARHILDKYAINAPAAVRRILNDPTFESPKPADVAHLAAEYRLIASPASSLAAAAEVARAAGVQVIELGDGIGGELTVTVNNPAGRGGPNAECALAFLIATEGRDGVFGLFADTDGIDGTEDNAGAIVTPALFATAAEEGIDAAALLRQNLSYDFFDAVGGLMVTGPTHTNVNDFRAVLLL